MTDRSKQPDDDNYGQFNRDGSPKSALRGVLAARDARLLALDDYVNWIAAAGPTLTLEEITSRARELRRRESYPWESA